MQESYLFDNFGEVGSRLRAHRQRRSLSPKELADRLGISRAALYRAERGEIIKIDTFVSIAKELDVSLPSLLGVGTEYLASAPIFFERMRQLEESSEQIIGVFSPVSYLLTSERYDHILADVLHEHLPPDAAPGDVQGISQILSTLVERKATFLRKRPLIASIISFPDLELFLRSGMTGSETLPQSTLKERRDFAMYEVQHIAELLRIEPIGMQIGIARQPMPSISFQIMKGAAGASLTISPFRLGHRPNVSIGVGMVTRAPEALVLHEQIARNLWDDAVKGPAAADLLEGLIERLEHST